MCVDSTYFPKKESQGETEQLRSYELSHRREQNRKK
jgi:hypothetical protein